MVVFESKEEMLCYLTSTGLGMSMLFSFNSFISSPSYVTHYYRYASGDENAVAQYPQFWKNAESYISVSNMIPNLVCQGFVFTKVVRRIPMQRKLLVSMVLIILAMLLIPLIPVFQVHEIFAAVTLVFASSLAGAATAFFQSTVFALVASLPPKHMGGVLFGIGLSGTTTCLIQITTKAAMNGGYADTQVQSKVFFGVAIGFMLVSFASLFALKANRYAQRYIVEYRSDDYVEDGLGISVKASPTTTASDVSKVSMATAIDPASPIPDIDETSSLITESSSSVSPAAVAGATPVAYAAQDSVEIIPVVKKIWPMMFSCTLTFFITLTVFPGVGVAVNQSDAWFGVIIIFMFNSGDTIGRFGSNIPRIWLPRRLVPMAAVCRLVVIPLFFFCITPKWIPGNVFPMILMFLTGISNGFIGSMSLVYGPQTPELLSDGERALAGNSMSMALLGGCSGGSMLALLITSYLPST